MTKVIAAPGPVSYPLIASGKVEVVFGKDSSEGDAIADSIVSLIRRGLRVHYGALRGVASIYPSITSPIAVWRRGSAIDVLTRAILDLYGVKGEVVYYEDFSEALELLNSGKVKAIAASSGAVKGIKFEEAFKAKGIEMPSSCGISIINERERENVVNAYLEGLDRLKEDPEWSAEKIAETVNRRRDFVMKVIQNIEPILVELKDYSDFESLVKKYL